MSRFARSRAGAVLTIALATTSLVAPVVTATAMTPAKPRPTGMRYVGEIVGTRSAPTDAWYGFGTAGVDIASSGAVLARRIDGNMMLGQPTRTRELPPAGGQYPWHVTMSPSGDVYGVTHDAVARWHGVRVETKAVANIGWYYTPTLAGATVNGLIGGCGHSVKTGWPVLVDHSTGSVRNLEWPSDSGTCSTGGMSDRGVTALTQGHPNYRVDNVLYPRAATMTTYGVRYLKAPAGVGTSAEAISANGRFIAGHTYKDGQVTGAAWLSATRNPVPLRGVGAMTITAVTDQGALLGTENGRAVMWENGRKSDLTKVSKLPRGWVLTTVAAVNTKGQIAATAQVGNTKETVAVRLSPRPARR